MTHALIDGDTIVFAPAVSSEGMEHWVAKARLDKMLSAIIYDSGCKTYEIFVSGEGNFRKEIDPTYKAQRPPSPPMREICHRHIIDQWGAIECHGYEADDAVGSFQRYDGSTMIVGIDKDLLQVPGLHYQWPLIRNNKVVREGRFLEISEEDGFRNFFSQVLTGDTSDNIKGVEGVGVKRAAKLLADCKTEEEMYTRCLITYLQDTPYFLGYVEAERERFEKNLDLLWIWRELGVTYSIRKEMNAE